MIGQEADFSRLCCKLQSPIEFTILLSYLKQAWIPGGLQFCKTTGGIFIVLLIPRDEFDLIANLDLFQEIRRGFQDVAGWGWRGVIRPPGSGDLGMGHLSGAVDPYHGDREEDEEHVDRGAGDRVPILDQDQSLSWTQPPAEL